MTAPIFIPGWEIYEFIPGWQDQDAKGCYRDYCKIMNARLRIVRALRRRGETRNTEAAE